MSMPTSIPTRRGRYSTVASLMPGRRATFEGRVNEVEDTTKGRRTLRTVLVSDHSGEINVIFRSGGGVGSTSSPVSCCGSPANPSRAATGRCR